MRRHWIGSYWNERTFCGIRRKLNTEVIYAVTGAEACAKQMKRVTCKRCRRSLGSFDRYKHEIRRLIVRVRPGDSRRDPGQVERN